MDVDEFNGHSLCTGRVSKLRMWTPTSTLLAMSALAELLVSSSDAATCGHQNTARYYKSGFVKY